MYMYMYMYMNFASHVGITMWIFCTVKRATVHLKLFYTELEETEVNYI